MNGQTGRTLKLRRSTWMQLTLCGGLLITAVLVYFGSMARLPVGPLLIASSVVALALYLMLLRSQLGQGEVLPSLTVAWLLGAILRVGLAGAYVGLATVMEPSEPVQLGPVHVSAYLLEGQAVLLAGDAWLLAGLIISQRISFKTPRLFKIRPRLSVGSVAVGLIAATLVLRVIDASTSLVRDLGNLPGVLMQYGVAAGIFCGLIAWVSSKSQNRQRRTPLFGARRILWPPVVAIIVVAEVGWQLQSYMRQGVLLALLPFWAFAWIRWRTGEWSGRVVVSGSVVGLLAVGLVVWPYGQIRRADVDHPAEIRNLPVMPYLEEVISAGIPGTEAWRRVHDFPSSGVWSLPGRMQLVSTAAGAVHLRKTSPGAGAEQLKLFARNLIPRAVWPEKPPYAPGRRVAVELGQGRSFGSVTTSTALSLPGGALWVLGPWVGLPLLTVTGLALGFLWRFWAPRMLRNPIAALGAMALWLQAFRMLEASVVLGLETILYQTLVLIPVALVWDLVWTLDGRRLVRFDPTSGRRESI